MIRYTERRKGWLTPLSTQFQSNQTKSNSVEKNRYLVWVPNISVLMSLFSLSDMILLKMKLVWALCVSGHLGYPSLWLDWVHFPSYFLLREIYLNCKTQSHLVNYNTQEALAYGGRTHHHTGLALMETHRRVKNNLNTNTNTKAFTPASNSKWMQDCGTCCLLRVWAKICMFTATSKTSF